MGNVQFEKNRKKSRHMALAFTVLFHLLVFGGLWYATSPEDSTVKTFMKGLFGSAEEEPTAHIENHLQP
jgi:hypothetical protein